MTIKNKTPDGQESSQGQDSQESNLESLLIEAGCFSPKLLADSNPYDLKQKLKCDLVTAENIIKWAINKIRKSDSMRSAEEVYQGRKIQPKLTTGSTALNNILGGGIEVGVMTEFFGHSGSGKTQLCYNLSINVQQPVAVGGLEGKAIYVDTENKFAPERIIEIATERNLDPERALKNISLETPINSIDQEVAIEKIATILEKENKIKLVIIDSIINYYRQEFIGRQSLSERQAKLEKCIRSLSNIAQLYNVTVVMTNQVGSEPDAFSTKPYVPAGGNVLAHASKHRIELKLVGGNIHAHILSSASLPCLDARFSINKCGIVDVL